MSSIEKAVEHLQSHEGPGSSRKTGGDRPPYKLDLVALEKEGFIVPGSSNTNVAEEYRILKRPVLMNAFGRGAAPIENGNLVMITSTMPGEGKTFTSINLAMSMAIELDTTVLLVDADVIRPTLTGNMGLRNRAGLIDVLLDKDKDLSDVIVPTDIDRLRLLPAGRAHSHSTELLSSSQMKELAADLARRYSDRVILIDAPPLLATTESRVIADLAGQILVVVEAGRTTQHAVTEAVATLDKNKAVGMVLNKSNHMFRRDYYYGSYGSGRKGS